MSGIQEWCQPHWDELRAAIDRCELGHLVSQGGAAAAAHMADDLRTGTARDVEGFDPLLRAWSMISGRALECGSGVIDCPLCFVQRHAEACSDLACQATPANWIAGCTESVREYVQGLGLLRRS